MKQPSWWTTPQINHTTRLVRRLNCWCVSQREWRCSLSVVKAALLVHKRNNFVVVYMTDLIIISNTVSFSLVVFPCVILALRHTVDPNSIPHYSTLPDISTNDWKGSWLHPAFSTLEAGCEHNQNFIGMLLLQLSRRMRHSSFLLRLRRCKFITIRWPFIVSNVADNNAVFPAAIRALCVHASRLITEKENLKALTAADTASNVMLICFSLEEGFITGYPSQKLGVSVGVT